MASPVAVVTPTRAVDFASLPARVDGLSGTALVNVAADLDREMKSKPDPGASFFLLVSSKNPQQGVLVEVPSLKPAELASKPSANLSVSGPVKTFEDAHLRDYVANKVGVHLAAQGSQIQYIVADESLFSPTPTLSPSPGAEKR
jgi:hypothetical protein